MKSFFVQKKKIIILFAVFFFSAFTIHAINYSKHQLVPSGHWVYNAIAAITLESGAVNFAQNAPLSIAELQLYLEDISYNNLSVSAQNTYDKILAYFQSSYTAYGNDTISLGTDLVLNPEVRYFSNLDMYDDTIGDTTNVVNYAHRPLFLEVPLIFSFGDYGVLRSDFSLALNYDAHQSSDVFFNLPLNAESIDLNFPQNSYFSTGFSNKEGQAFFNFQLGQNQVSVGNTQTGSIIISDSLVGASFAQLSFFSTNLRYAMTPMQIEVDKYLYLHRFEFRLFKRVSIAILEGILISQPFELRFLNPAAIFHNMNPWMNYGDSEDSNATAYLGLTIDVNPWKYIRLYGLFAMNQFQTESEIEGGGKGSTIPNGIGAQAGLESYIPFQGGYMYVGFEGVYTSPWLYRSHKNAPSFSKDSIYISSSGNSHVSSWIGYPYGPDNLVGQFKIGYTKIDAWSVFLAYRIRAQGEITFDSPYPYNPDESPEVGEESNPDAAKLSTPSGVPVYEHRVEASGFYRVNKFVSTNAVLAYVHRLNNEHVQDNTKSAVELSISACIEFSPFLTGGN